jgi:hypothetical protein
MKPTDVDQRLAILREALVKETAGESGRPICGMATQRSYTVAAHPTSTQLGNLVAVAALTE